MLCTCMLSSLGSGVYAVLAPALHAACGLILYLRSISYDFSAGEDFFSLCLSRPLHYYRRHGQGDFFTACRVLLRGHTGASPLSMGGWEDCWVLLTASASPRMGKGTVPRSAPGTARSGLTAPLPRARHLSPCSPARRRQIEADPQ